MIQRVLVASLLCAYAVSVQSAEEPEWLKTARAREAPPHPATLLTSEDGWLKTTVPAKLVGKIQKSDESYSLEFDLGTDTPAYCEIFPDGFDLADTLRLTYEGTIARVGEIQGKIEVRANERVDAGALGDIPYLAADWIYRVRAKEGAHLGAIKQIVLEKNGHGIYCNHVDIGFTKTFSTLAHALAQTLVTQSKPPAPYYVEISTVTVSQSKIGVAMTEFTKDADGDTVAVQRSAMLIPGPDGSVRSQDSVHKEWVREDGSMINAVDFLGVDGELASKMEIRLEDEKWLVEGEVQGKKVKQALAVTGPIATSIGMARAIRKVLAEPDPVGKTVSLPQWTSADASKLTDTKVTIKAKKGGDLFAAELLLATLKLDATLDQNGMATAAEFPMGPTKAKIERVFVSGSF